MKYFNNFKEAHEYYEYPSTHRVGTIGDSNGVIRSYSNGKKGDILVVHGPTKSRVGEIAMRLFERMRVNQYTMKGAHLAFHPVKKVIPKKKSKKA